MRDASVIARRADDVPAPGTVEQSLEEILDRITDGFVACDANWRFTFINREAERYYQRPREELLGRVVWEVFPAAAGTALERAYRDTTQSHRPVQFEMQSPVTGRWISHRLFPTEHGLAIYFRDVTEEREAEELRRAGEARWRSLFENSLEAQLLTAPDGRILEANPAAERLLAASANRICRAGRTAFVDDADPRAKEFLEKRRRDGRAQGEFTMRRADGTTFEAEISSRIFVDLRGEERTSMSVRDVTERKRAEAAMRLIAEAGRVLSASLDTSTTLRHLTSLLVPRFADLCVVDLRHPAGQVVRVAVSQRDQALTDRLAAFDERHVEPLIRRVLDSGEAELISRVSEDWLRDAAASEEQVEVVRALGVRSAIVVPLLVSGRAIGVLSLCVGDGRTPYDQQDLDLARGLADRAALAIENARLYEAAVEANRLRDDVLGIVSHDLRNPLNAISVAAQIIERKGDPVENLKTIRRAVARADRLIADLLLASQIEAGRLPLRLEPCPVRPLIEEVVSLHEPAATAKGITVRAEVAEALPDVRMDRHRILQVLENLIGNALKFTERGGEIVVSAEQRGDSLVLRIRDTGTGIPEADLPRLFDRFWQGARKRRAGAGLGLAIAKGVIEAHGGTISVESTVGRGSTFECTLPLAARP